MKVILTVLLLFGLLSLQPLLADGSLSSKIIFEKNYILISVSENIATINKLRSNKFIKVKIGDTFEAPIDKHSKTTYTITSIGRGSVEIKYRNRFDASSFGGSVTKSEGKFVITVTK